MKKKDPGTPDLFAPFFFRARSLLLYHSGLLDLRFRRSLKKGAPPWRIIRYERIADPENHIFPLLEGRYVRPITFEQHLNYLSKECHVMSLGDLINRIDGENSKHLVIPPKTVVITLDCGYLDAYTNAFPLLERYKLPATIFLAAGYIGTEEQFWFDQVMLVGLELHRQGLGWLDVPNIKDYFTNIPQKSDLPSFIEQTSQFISMLFEADADERGGVLAVLSSKINEIGGFTGERTFLDWDQVRSMSQAQISFGTLGSYYRPCTELTQQQFVADLHRSILLLRENKIPTLDTYAFPEGVTDQASKQSLKSLGVRYAFGIGQYPPLDRKPKETLYFGRVPMYERVSFSTDYFASRLWT